MVELFDKDGDGTISRDEWMNGWMKEGKRLPDFGVGIITIKVIDDWHWRKSSVWDTMRLAFEVWFMPRTVVWGVEGVQHDLGFFLEVFDLILFLLR